MRISAKIEYACLAMLELATRYESGEPVRLRDICDKHDIPSGFLVQILLQLKCAGLVHSTRGAAGGYQLQLPPDEISLDAVMDVIEPEERSFGPDQDTSLLKHILNEAWQTAEDSRRQHLTSLTLGELCERVRSERLSMYYI